MDFLSRLLNWHVPGMRESYPPEARAAALAARERLERRGLMQLEIESEKDVKERVEEADHPRNAARNAA